uniref:G-protein coupled receptors family 1 profile domain-containing protein n=1 Tax=Takifugu rubripes TaxID=31033 RepID=A0A674NV89_TAKRU
MFLLFGLTNVVSPYLLCAIFGLLSVITVCGNLLVITAILYFRQLHSPTHYLILSLAVADLLVGVLVLPFSAVLIVEPCFYLQTFICRVRNSCDMFLSTTSILNLCFISVDRYHAVCQPLKYRMIINVRATVGMIAVSWTLPVLIGIGITMNDLNPKQSKTRCLLFQNPSLILLIIGTVVFFYLPAVIILTTYLKILIVAQRQARAIKNAASLSRAPGEMLNKTQRKATRILAIVMGIFFLCLTPFFLCLTFNHFNYNTLTVSVIEFFKCLGWSNSMLNPFVYAFFYSWFRSAFKMIISGQIFQGDFMNSKLF